MNKIILFTGALLMISIAMCISPTDGRYAMGNGGLVLMWIALAVKR